MSDLLWDTAGGYFRVFGLAFVILALVALTQCSINEQIAKENAVKRETVEQAMQQYEYRNDYLHRITMVPKIPVNDSWITKRAEQ